MKSVRPAGGAGQAGAGEAGAGRLAEALSRVVAGDRIVTGPGVLQAMSRDDAGWAPAGRAAAGVRARPALDPRGVFNPGKG